MHQVSTDGLSTLHQIDPLTGEATEIGPIGFERVPRLVFGRPRGRCTSPVERDDGSDAVVLITIDLETGLPSCARVRSKPGLAPVLAHKAGGHARANALLLVTDSSPGRKW